MSLRTVLAVVVLCAASAAPSVAQTSAGARSGTWMTAGIGGGWTRLTCSICRTDRLAGPAVSLRFGTTLRPGLLIGAEVDGWTRTEDDIRTVLTAGSAAAYIFPNPSRGLFLKAGAGLVHLDFDGGDAGANLIGLLLGAGYEFPITDELNLTNTIGLIASSFGRVRADAGTIADDVSISLLHIGISVTHR